MTNIILLLFSPLLTYWNFSSYDLDKLSPTVMRCPASADWASVSLMNKAGVPVRQTLGLHELLHLLGFEGPSISRHPAIIAFEQARK